MAKKIIENEDGKIITITDTTNVDGTAADVETVKNQKDVSPKQLPHEFRTFRQVMMDMKSDVKRGKHKHAFFNTVMVILECILIYAIICCVFAVVVGYLIPMIGVIIIGFTGVKNLSTGDQWSVMAGYTAPYIFAMIILSLAYLKAMIVIAKYINKARKYVCDKHAYFSNIKAENKAKRLKNK